MNEKNNDNLKNINLNNDYLIDYDDKIVSTKSEM